MKRRLLMAGLLAAAGTGAFLIAKAKRPGAALSFDPSRGLPPILVSRVIPDLLEDTTVLPGDPSALVGACRERVAAWRPVGEDGEELRRRELLVIDEISRVRNTREEMLGTAAHHPDGGTSAANLDRISKREAWAEYAAGERGKLAAMLRATRLLAAR